MRESIIIKTTEEIEKMRKGGKILAAILDEIEGMVKPDMPTMELEKRFIELCEKHNVLPSCKGYAPYNMPPFPTGLCVSLNHESVHNFPKEGKIIKDSDIVNIDSMITYEGVFLDSARSVQAGTKTKRVQDFINTIALALEEGIKVIKPGTRTGEISNKIETIVRKAGYMPILEYSGHGVGRKMHEAPDIPSFGKKWEGDKLKENMTLAIEPLICEKNSLLGYNSAWETFTEDKSLFCQIEHTVLVTKKGYEILTTNA